MARSIHLRIYCASIAKVIARFHYALQRCPGRVAQWDQSRYGTEMQRASTVVAVDVT